MAFVFPDKICANQNRFHLPQTNRGENKHIIPKTNMEPENRPCQNEREFTNHPFSGAMIVLGREITLP